MPGGALVVLLLLVLGDGRAALLQQGRGDDLVLVSRRRDVVPRVLGPHLGLIREESGARVV